MKTKSDVIRDFIIENDYFTLPSRQLAKMLIHKMPDVFGDYNDKNIDKARGLVKTIRHSHGIKKQSPEDQIFADRFRGFMEPDVNDYATFEIPESIVRLGVIADVHLPFFDKPAYDAAIKWLSAHNCDAILINGDFMDCYHVSDFLRDRRKRNMVQEFDMAREMLDELSSIFGRVFYKLGNHEERIERRALRAIPDLLEFLTFEDCLTNRGKFDLSEYRIEIIKDKRIVKFTDNLSIIHGHEYGKSFSNPVGVARWLYLKAGSNAMCSHSHMVSDYASRSIEDHTIKTWSTGCLCDLHPEWKRLNQWQHGFARVKRDGDIFRVTNLSIENGKVY